MEKTKKFDSEKLPIHLVDPVIIEEIAKVMKHGAVKYGENNWRAGLPLTRYYSATQRHLLSWLKGEELDQSGINHLSHAAANIMMMLYQLKNEPDLDDRFTKGKIVVPVNHELSALRNLI